MYNDINRMLGGEHDDIGNLYDTTDITTEQGYKQAIVALRESLGRPLKVTFDFDNCIIISPFKRVEQTIAIPFTQKMAAWHKSQGDTISILTARADMESNRQFYQGVFDTHRIHVFTQDDIVFTAGKYSKFEYINKNDVDVHYDDDTFEVQKIRENSPNCLIVDMLQMPDIKALINTTWKRQTGHSYVPNGDPEEYDYESQAHDLMRYKDGMTHPQAKAEVVVGGLKGAGIIPTDPYDGIPKRWLELDDE